MVAVLKYKWCSFEDWHQMMVAEYPYMRVIDIALQWNLYTDRDDEEIKKVHNTDQGLQMFLPIWCESKGGSAVGDLV